MKQSKNEKLLKDLIEYCKDHPEERFWQALRNWAAADFIFVEKSGEMVDTFFWENKIN